MERDKCRGQADGRTIFHTTKYALVLPVRITIGEPEGEDNIRPVYCPHKVGTAGCQAVTAKGGLKQGACHKAVPR